MPCVVCCVFVVCECMHAFVLVLALIVSLHPNYLYSCGCKSASALTTMVLGGVQAAIPQTLNAFPLSLLGDAYGILCQYASIPYK